MESTIFGRTKEEYRKWYVKTMEELIKKGYENVLNVPKRNMDRRNVEKHI